MTSPLNLPAPGRCQAVYFMFSISHSHVFLLNSRLDLFSAAPLPERPLSRSYRTILPSSLTVTHSSASVYSTQLRVSFSTGIATICLAVFLGSPFTPILPCACTRHTFRFDSLCGFAYRNLHLHPSTGYSVSRQDCHTSVPTSLMAIVTEY